MIRRVVRPVATMPARDPAAYENWYQTPRGRWIGEREASLLLALMRPVPGGTLLDAGCGTGYFSRQFADAGLTVTGLDPDAAMLDYARRQSGGVAYIRGAAERLPFDDECFDYSAAVTSLCFVTDPSAALAELWRVSRRGVALGLLNRRSLLHAKKRGGGGYSGARWDSWASASRWIAQLTPPVVMHAHRTAIVLPGGGLFARLTEPLNFGRLPWGGFLAVYIARRG